MWRSSVLRRAGIVPAGAACHRAVLSNTPPRAPPMVTVFLRYVLDPHKLADFEHYGRRWIPLVERFGGRHHGYFMTS